VDLNFNFFLQQMVKHVEKILLQYPCVIMIIHINIQSDSFGTRPKKMRISQRLFIRF
jgi:hypothetical protein